MGPSIGIEFVKLKYDISDAFFYCVNSIASGDFVGKLAQALRGETPIKEYKLFLLKEKIPTCLIHLFCWFNNKNPQRFRKLVNCTINKTMKDLTRSLHNVQTERIKVEQLMLSEGIEGILAPGGALPAMKHNFAWHLPGIATYPFFFSMLNFPAGSIPMSHVRADEQYYDCNIDDEITRFSKEVMKDSVGLPVGVQVGCRPHREELVLNIMRRYQAILPKVEYPIHPR